MTENQPRRFRWFRFTLSNLFVLTAGVAIGFAPLKLWELYEPPSPQIAIHIRAFEVQNGELAALGLAPDRIPVGGIRMADVNPALEKQLDAMTPKQAKLLAEPSLMTLSGRPVYFNVGGEVPVEVPKQDGTTIVEYREIGMRLDLAPVLLRNGRIQLDSTTKYTTAEGSSELPSFSTQSATSGIEVAERETVVLSHHLGYAITSKEDAPFTQRTMLILATLERPKAR